MLLFAEDSSRVWFDPPDPAPAAHTGQGFIVLAVAVRSGVTGRGSIAAPIVVLPACRRTSAAKILVRSAFAGRGWPFGPLLPAVGTVFIVAVLVVAGSLQVPSVS